MDDRYYELGIIISVGIICVTVCIFYAIKLYRRERKLLEECKYKDSFSFKEPFSTAILYGVIVVFINGLLCVALIRNFMGIHPSKHVVDTIGIVLSLWWDYTYIRRFCAHWKKKIEVNGHQIIYTNGVGREFTIYPQQILEFGMTDRGGTYRFFMAFIDENGQKRNIFMGVPYEMIFYLNGWRMRYFTLSSKGQIPLHNTQRIYSNIDLLQEDIKSTYISEKQSRNTTQKSRGVSCLIWGIISLLSGVLYIPLCFIILVLTVMVEGNNVGAATPAGAVGVIIFFVVLVFMPILSFIAMIVTIILAIRDKKLGGCNARHVAGLVCSLAGPILSFMIFFAGIFPWLTQR